MIRAESPPKVPAQLIAGCATVGLHHGHAVTSPRGARVIPAVPELHLRQIARYCRRQVPELARDQVQVNFHLRGRHVTIVERRAPWRVDLGPEWTAQPIAQLRWTPPATDGEQGSWRLYWADRNQRWHRVSDAAPERSPGPLLTHIDRHPAPFWG